MMEAEWSNRASYIFFSMHKWVEEWRQSVKRMTIEELIDILLKPEYYDRVIINLVRDRIIRLARIKVKKEDVNLNKAAFEVRDAVIVYLHRMKLRFIKDKGSDKDIYFDYENRRFMLSAGNDGPFITIYNCNWLTLPLECIELVSRLKRAINLVNSTGLATTFYINYELEREMRVSSSVRLLFIEHIPHREELFQSMLKNLISIEEIVNKALQSLYEEEHPDEKFN